MENNFKQSHQLHLDSLRGIAALIVVFTHYVGAFLPYSCFADQGNYQQLFSFENFFFYPPFGLLISGRFAVCLFFILSGYVLSYNYLGEPRNLKKISIATLKRPIRLGGVVLFTILLGSLLWYKGLYFNLLVSNISNSNPWFSELWKGTLNIESLFLNISNSLFSKAEIYNASLWTIKEELYGSLLVYLTLFLFSHFKYRFVVITLLIVFFIKSFYQGFFLGMLVADIVKHRPLVFSNNIKKVINFFCVTAFLYLSSYPHFTTHDFVVNNTIYSLLPDASDFESGYPMIAALLLFCFICLNNKAKIILNSNILVFFGKISYGLYGVHLLVLGSLSSWLFLYLHDSAGYFLSFLIVLSSGILVNIALGYLITLTVDKPAIKLADLISRKVINQLQLIVFSLLR